MSTSTTCPECGQSPMGTACYHICPNSVHFYSPEQERADEANYDPSEYYREGGFDDIDAMAEADERDCEERDASPFQVVGLLTYDPQTDFLIHSNATIPF